MAIRHKEPWAETRPIQAESMDGAQYVAAVEKQQGQESEHAFGGNCPPKQIDQEARDKVEKPQEPALCKMSEPCGDNAPYS